MYKLIELHKKYFSEQFPDLNDCHYATTYRPNSARTGTLHHVQNQYDASL
jgi:hypothetical protein